MKKSPMMFLFPVKNVILCSVLSVMIAAAGCSKDGDTGATGAEGPAGPAGPAGPTGPAGSSPVIYSGWKNATNFNDSTIDGSVMKVGYVACPASTSSILSSGDVKVYLNFGAGSFVLPYTSFAGGKVNTVSFVPIVNRIVITRFTHDNTNSTGLPSSLQYRYVIIPGGVTGRYASVVDWNDYAAVAAYLGWRD